MAIGIFLFPDDEISFFFSEVPSFGFIGIQSFWVDFFDGILWVVGMGLLVLVDNKTPGQNRKMNDEGDT